MISERPLQYRLANHLYHVDFCRIKRADDRSLWSAWSDFVYRNQGQPERQLFFCLGEWDALAIRKIHSPFDPRNPHPFTEPRLASCLSGNVGFLNYEWNIDEDPKILATGTESCPHLCIVARSHEWFRSHLALIGEQAIAVSAHAKARQLGVHIICLHGLGWYDFTIKVSAQKPGDEQRVWDFKAWFRNIRLRDILREESTKSLPPHLEAFLDNRLLTVTYSHVILPFQAYLESPDSIPNMPCKYARVLYRFDSTAEDRLASMLADLEITELGRYTTSEPIDLEAGIARKIQSRRAEIARQLSGRDCLCETTTILRTEPDSSRGASGRPLDAVQSTPAPMLKSRHKDEIIQVLKFLNNPSAPIGNILRFRLQCACQGVLAWIGNPIAGPSMERIASFLANRLRPLIQRFDLKEGERLCHVLEVALDQASKGLGQILHDSHAESGLQARGGYARILTAAECYVNQLLDRFGVPERPLLTIGVHDEAPGMLDEYHIDIDYSVALMPRRWYTLLHEVGHILEGRLAQISMLGMAAYANKNDAEPPPGIAEPEPWSFARASLTIAEIVPYYITCAIAFGGDLKLFLAELTKATVARSYEAASVRFAVQLVTRAILLERLMHDIAQIWKEHGPSRQERLDVDGHIQLGRAYFEALAKWQDLGITADHVHEKRDEVDAVLMQVADQHGEHDPTDDRRPNIDRSHLSFDRPNVHHLGILRTNLQADQFAKAVIQHARGSFEAMSRLGTDKITAEDEAAFLHAGSTLYHTERASGTVRRHKHSSGLAAIRDDLAKGLIRPARPRNGATFLAALTAEGQRIDEASFSRSQLCAILTMWHAAMLERGEQLTDDPRAFYSSLESVCQAMQGA